MLQPMILSIPRKGEQPEITCDKCGTILTRDQWGRHIEEGKELEDLQARGVELCKKLEMERTLADKYKEGLEAVRSDRKKVGASLS